ncbi:FAD:protein FMN transferase [Clostridiaceae bacterium UIB06]|nr:FAD:protein FMN transferase [Clostridiaceae bacterium UIB06]
MLITIGNVLILLTLLLFSILILIFSTGKSKRLPIIRESYSLGTIIQLKIYGRRAERVAEEAMEKLNEIDDKMSAFKDYSEISKINAHAGKEPQVVSKDTYFVIKKAVEYCSLSHRRNTWNRRNIYN